MHVEYNFGQQKGENIIIGFQQLCVLGRKSAREWMQGTTYEVLHQLGYRGNESSQYQNRRHGCNVNENKTHLKKLIFKIYLG